jgi:hypothetical protein
MPAQRPLPLPVHALALEQVGPVQPPVEEQSQVLRPTHTPPLAHGAKAHSKEPA